MLILVTYDVNTETSSGRARLRKVAKVCTNYGQRVQNSVFECLLDASQYVEFRAKLEKIINTEKDSLRFYELGNKYKHKVVHIGIHPDVAQDDILIDMTKLRKMIANTFLMFLLYFYIANLNN